LRCRRPSTAPAILRVRAALKATHAGRVPHGCCRRCLWRGHTSCTRPCSPCFESSRTESNLCCVAVAADGRLRHVLYPYVHIRLVISLKCLWHPLAELSTSERARDHQRRVPQATGLEPRFKLAYPAADLDAPQPRRPSDAPQLIRRHDYANQVGHGRSHGPRGRVRGLQASHDRPDRRDCSAAVGWTVAARATRSAARGCASQCTSSTRRSAPIVPRTDCRRSLQVLDGLSGRQAPS
jgi:hypothetical protein